MKIRWVTCGYA